MVLAIHYLLEFGYGDRFYALPVQSPGCDMNAPATRWDNLLKSNAANERGG